MGLTSGVRTLLVRSRVRLNVLFAIALFQGKKNSRARDVRLARICFMGVVSSNGLKAATAVAVLYVEMPFTTASM